MYFEKLALEVNASIAGLETMKPAIIKGESGVDHKFTFLAMDDSKAFGFDIYPKVGEVEVLRAFVKKIDTGADVFVVCLSGRPEPEVQKMAEKYEVEVIGPGEVGNFFSSRIARLVKSEQMKVRR